MAALHEIARQYAEEIRDGIAWVIIWKTGRSWHAESVWLNQDSDTFELEDLSTATEILEQDPNAVMVNGYYCGHFGENMTIAELEAGILWHYEGGCNLLKDSTAFPPEPIPRPENLPADIPWYGKETTEEPDPYIFDGYMSVEDYEKRQQLIAADQARSDPLPDESPPEPQHTELTIQIGPPAATALLGALADAIKAAAHAVRQLMDELAERFRKFRQYARKAVNTFVDSLLYRANTHPEMVAPIQTRTEMENPEEIQAAAYEAAMQQAGRWIGGDPMNDSRNLSEPVLMPGATAAAMKYAKSAGWTGM